MMSQTRAMVDKLRELLVQRLGVPINVTETPANHGPLASEAQNDGLTIMVSITHYGDPYAGGHYTDTVTFAGGGLQIRFSFAEHDLSGQCDIWELDVRGADPDERATFAEIFHPHHRQGHWGNHARIEYVFDGTRGAF